MSDFLGVPTSVSVGMILLTSIIMGLAYRIDLILVQLKLFWKLLHLQLRTI